MASIPPTLGGHGGHCPRRQQGPVAPRGQGVPREGAAHGVGAAWSRLGRRWLGAMCGKNPYDPMATAIPATSTPQGLHNLRGPLVRWWGAQSSPSDPPQATWPSPASAPASAPNGPAAGVASQEHLDLPPKHLAQQQPEDPLPAGSFPSLHLCQHCCLTGVWWGQACDIIVLTGDFTRGGLQAAAC